MQEFLSTFLIGRCAEFGPEAQSEIAQLLIEMEGEMSRRLQQADIGDNNLPSLEGITWNPEDPLAGTTEAIDPFGMLDVWSTFVRTQPESMTPPPRREPPPPRREPPPPRREPPTRSEGAEGEGPGVPGIASGGRYFYGVHTTDHCTVCSGRYDNQTDACQGYESRARPSMMPQYHEGIDHQRQGRVDRQRYERGASSDISRSCDRAYRLGVDRERRSSRPRFRPED